MTRTRMLCLAGVLLVTTGIKAQSQRAEMPSISDVVLSPGKAGRVEVGMLVADVYRLFGPDRVHLLADFPEGMFQPVLEITLAGHGPGPALRAEIGPFPCGEDAVSRITVLDPRMKTADGLGVGTTEAELRRRFSFTLDEAEGCHCAIIKPLGMTFRLGGPASRQRVTSVMLSSDPNAVRAKHCPDQLVPRGR